MVVEIPQGVNFLTLRVPLPDFAHAVSHNSHVHIFFLGQLFKHTKIFIPFITCLMRNHQLATLVLEQTDKLDCLLNPLPWHYPGRLQNKEIILFQSQFTSHIRCIFIRRIGRVIKIKYIGNHQGGASFSKSQLLLCLLIDYHIPHIFKFGRKSHIQILRNTIH